MRPPAVRHAPPRSWQPLTRGSLLAVQAIEGKVVPGVSSAPINTVGQDLDSSGIRVCSTVASFDPEASSSRPVSFDPSVADSRPVSEASPPQSVMYRSRLSYASEASFDPEGEACRR